MKKIASLHIILFWSFNFVLAQLSFKPSISLDKNFGPGPMVSGDFDGNSFPDLAVLDQNYKRVLLYYNPGQVAAPETQIFQVQSPGSGSVASLTAADFNNDGKTDLALVDYANNQQSLVLLTSTGSSFSQQAIPSLENSPYNYVMKALDYDLDGNIDLIVSNSFSFLFYKGDGKGGFSASALSAFPTIYNNNYFLFDVSDLNADGKNDIVFTASDTIFVCLQNANQSFTTSKYLMPSNNHIALSLGTGDLTGDGFKDILITYQINNSQTNVPNFIAEYVNKGSGAFGSAPVTIFSGDLWAVPLVLKDFDGDGRIDVLTGGLNSQAEFYLLKNAGNNNFTNLSLPCSYDTDEVTCLFVDLNNNGIQDIVVLSYYKFINIFSQSSGTFQYDHRLVFGAPAYRGLTVDVNKDGLPDIMSYSQISGSVAMYLNEGNSSFASPTFSITEDNGLSAVQAADFNGDGVPDIAYCSVLSSVNGFVKVILSDANGKLTIKKTLMSSGNTVLAAADYNKDGFIDLAAVNVIFFNDGSGNFSPYYYSVGFTPFNAAAADVNHDSFPDLIFNDASFTYVSLNDGSGHFQTFNTIATSGYSDGIDVLDMNNDNLPDILSIHTTTNGADGFSLFINQGNGSFQQSIIPGQPGQNVFWSVAGGDLNNDGRKDVVYVSGSSASGGVSIYLQQADGTFAYYSSVPIMSGAGWAIVDYLRIADMNNDGKNDIVSYADNGDPVEVIFNDLITTPTQAAQIELTSVSDTKATFTLSGGNGDGKLAVIRKTGTLTSKPNNSVFYSSNAQFGIGALIGSNNYVVLFKDTTAFSVAGLTKATSYTIDVYSYNVNSANSITNILIAQPDSIVFTTKNTQSITVTPVSEQVLGAPPVLISATVSSGLPITFSVAGGGISIKGDTITLVSPGPAKIIATAAGDTSYAAASAEIDFCVDPPVPTIAVNQNGTVISLSSSSASNNTWIFNDVPIDSAKNSTLRVVNNGIYEVLVNFGGCKSTSTPTDFIIAGIIDEKNKVTFSYPNPFNEILYVPLNGQATQIELFDATGRKVLEKSVLCQSEEQLNTAYLAAGLYFLCITTNQGILGQKLIRSGK
jgi:hypothetical protein